VVALDQKGGGGNLQETRLYVYPDEERKVLYLITIGNKDEQQSDIQTCNGFVELLKKPNEPEKAKSEPEQTIETKQTTKSP